MLELAMLLGFAMAFAIGANDVANSMATAVGAKAITPKQAVFISGILEFLGAALFGSQVTKTIAKGIVHLEMIDSTEKILTGAMAALVASTVWIIFATIWGMPVSTTHSIVGGMLGFGIAASGWHAVNWVKMGIIALTWITSPFIGGVIAYAVFKFISIAILHRKDPAKASKIWTPLLVGVAFYIIALLLGIKTLKLSILNSNFFGIIAGLISYVIVFLYVRKFKSIDPYETVERIFRKAQVVTSCYVSFSHGANDVANALGPLALMYIILKTGYTSGVIEIPKWILAFGGLGIAFGVALLGYRVMKTVGEGITELNNTRGFSIDFATATTVFIASFTGIPVSSTHTVVGAVTGVGLARGIEVVNVGILKNIIISWLVTVPFAAGVSYLIVVFFS
ncbi:MAG: inorganic phosphate transporter [Thermotogaceae bacterium]|nr:inorganic phosphate transporter [Thermotogaceae bacterium]